MADVFAVQDEISAAITGALQVKLSTSAAAKPRYTPKLDAYEAVLRGRREMQRWTPESLEHARELYQRAIELDPDYALARCALATNFFSMATEQVIPPREAAVMMNRLAHEALSISAKQGEHDLSEAHAVLGLAATLNYEWDLGAHHFRLAFRDNPPSPMMRIYHSMLFLASVGRSQEALAQLESLLPEDPLNLLLRVQSGLMGTEAFAEQRMLRLLETDPDVWIASMFLAGCYLRKGDLAKARTYAERSYALYPAHHGNVGCLAAILSLMGEEERAARLLRELGPDEAGGAPSGWVAYHMGRGETALAAAWMEKVIDQRDTRAPYLLPRCYWPDIRTSEYWPALARRMNLPQSGGPHRT